MKWSSSTIFLQGFAGMLVAVVGFVSGTLISSKIHGTGTKYLSPLGEICVGTTILTLSLLVAALFKFRTASVFAAAGLTAGCVVLVMLSMSGGFNMGLLSDAAFVWRHTAAPVALAGVLLWLGRCRPMWPIRLGKGG